MVLGGVVAGAARAGGTHLTQAAQEAGANVADYAPQEDDPDSPDAWADANADDIAASVQGHTGRMLVAALAGAVLIGAGIAAMASSASALYDQWLGLTDAGDYAEQLAGDLTVSGWGMGEAWGIDQITSGGAWSAEKTWNTMGDNRVRASHVDVDGMSVDASDSFQVGGADLDGPGDPSGPDAEVSGCRCWLTWTLINNQTGETQDIGADEEAS